MSELTPGPGSARDQAAPTGFRRRLARAAALYRATALFVLNTLVACAVGLGGWAAVRAIRQHLRDVAPNPVTAKYRRPLVDLYPGLSEGEIDILLRETWGRPYQFESFTQFKERPYRGRYVTVDDAGFRVGPDQAPWPPDPRRWNVFVFGGSNTFGYGVPDGDTVVARLQQRLSALAPARAPALYNFGRGHYYSSQERVLFEKLLEQGVRPHVALFIDGLNDFSFVDEPAFTPELSECVDDRWRRAFGLPPPPARPSVAFVSLAGVDAGKLDGPALDAAAGAAVERYLRNKTLIEAEGRAMATETLFVWQPIPLYGYDLQRHPFRGPDLDRHRVAARGYELMAKRHSSRQLGDDFIWCADLQRGLEEPLYVDAVHYTGRFADRFAAAIAEEIRVRWLAPEAARGNVDRVGSR